MSDDVYSTHYDVMRRYLTTFLQEQGSMLGRNNAKEKLGRLSERQFYDLSTDVFDEINRRRENDRNVPFLPVRNEFTPKRNQARQKLATLQEFRFKELASEVFFELERRFPRIVQENDARYGPLYTDSSSRPGVNGFQGPRAVSPNRPLPNPFQPPARMPTTASGRQIPQRGASRGAIDTAGRARRGGSPPPPMPMPTTRGMETLQRQPTELMPRNGTSTRGTTGRGGVTNEEFERMKARYEAEIETLRKQLSGQAPSPEIKKLNAELAMSKMAKRDIKQKYDVLLTDYETIQEELKAQEQAAEALRKDVNSLLEDVQTLSQKNQRLKEDKERDAETIRQLREEVERLGGEAGSVTASTPRTRNDSAKGDLFFSAEDDGEDPRILAYQDAAERLVIAARGSTPTNVLIAMKSVIISIKGITEDAERLEARVESTDDFTDLETAREQVSDALANLVAIAKEHATSYNKNDIGVLEDGVQRVDEDVRNLVAIMKRAGGDALLEGGPDDDRDDTNGLEKRRRGSRVLEVVELKIFIEDETDAIVSLIQTLVSSLKTGTPESSNSTIQSIKSSVDDIIFETGRTRPMLDSDTRSQSDVILEVLQEAVDNLVETGEELLRSEGNRTVKQKIGTCSYEVAKHVKSLLGLFE
ncbi:uncharacterized protein SPPG_06404 [Spizellomyces punctatus DAOM BR117]|uniref:GIT Spa2 homology (SHD) domain-containing protein n=1 Tax=Spizellomyces punctatus (strain DAOM BR117) TaxID=645134 RepID=A0A0L0HCN5_SPIPD|nr:uncharacterized protein SPPG_06404 [Spizellomyces punctatus DAOM BR117]KNC98726.1 hypothetical protein SPPG_06404 [Spizellomyces punctatus DAOM BR117]|eukprot:XP_016606766.1 hypothetical protein SPPG_06404 [Spizellomyces punctatus DAOM BR117]